MVNTGLSSRKRSKSMITYGINKGVERVKEVEELLPGIPDDITVNKIATKLPWTMFYTLSSVSRRWEAAVTSHQLFQARCFSQCTQTLFAFEYRDWTQPNPHFLLYSPDDGFVYHLPLIPGFDRRVLGVNCQCVFLEGKLYALGGDRAHPDYSNVHVFDLCGRGQWKPCASMKDDREDFQCGVMNGKIYVFGGREIEMIDNMIRPVIGCEVYDPVQDFWSPITSDATIRLRHRVIPVGDEFLFCNRWIFATDRSHSYSSFADFYNPAKDQWRRVQNFPPYYQAPLLAVIGGKLHRLDCNTTKVYDTDTNVWTEIKSVFNPALDPPVMRRLIYCAVVKNALFAIVGTRQAPFAIEDVCIMRCHRSHSNKNDTKQGRRHSGDAQSEHQMVWDTWQRLDFCYRADQLYTDPVLMCPVQL